MGQDFLLKLFLNKHFLNSVGAWAYVGYKPWWIRKQQTFLGVPHNLTPFSHPTRDKESNTFNVQYLVTTKYFWLQPFRYFERVLCEVNVKRIWATFRIMRLSTISTISTLQVHGMAGEWRSPHCDICIVQRHTQLTDSDPAWIFSCCSPLVTELFLLWDLNQCVRYLFIFTHTVHYILYCSVQELTLHVNKCRQAYKHHRWQVSQYHVTQK